MSPGFIWCSVLISSGIVIWPFVETFEEPTKIDEFIVLHVSLVRTVKLIRLIHLKLVLPAKLVGEVWKRVCSLKS